MTLARPTHAHLPARPALPSSPHRPTRAPKLLPSTFLPLPYVMWQPPPYSCHLPRPTSIAPPPSPHHSPTPTLLYACPTPTLCVPPLSPSHSLTPYDSYLPRASHRPTPTVRVPPPSRHLHRSRLVSSTTPTHALSPPAPSHTLSSDLFYFPVSALHYTLPH